MFPPHPTVHVPVLLAEVLEFGRPTAGEFWVDGTAGGGGHSRALAESAGKLVAIDRDPLAVQRLLALELSSTNIQCGSYENIPEILNSLGLPQVHGILLDLGLSSDQLAAENRGFSFGSNGLLDMRFDQESGQPVWEWINSADEQEIANVIYQYGEERFSRRIAKKITETRQKISIQTASQLREIIVTAVPPASRHGRLDPATRTFQALRIFINDELNVLQRALQRLPDSLFEGGRLVVISFHSLEDRIVKQCFRSDPRLEVLTAKPVTPQISEVAANPRSRSAKMRVAVRRYTKSTVTKNKYAAFSKVDPQK